MSPDRAKRQRPARGKSLIPDPPPRNPAVWALFDRDQHPDVPTAFALVRQHNAEAGIKPDMVNVEVAFSNPSFDLWLLLHFQSVNSPQDGSSDWVHEKLRKCPDFSGFARDTAGGKRLNREQAARLMRPDRIAAAVRNARSLAKRARSRTARSHQDTPITAIRCAGTRRPTSGGSSRAWGLTSEMALRGPRIAFSGRGATAVMIMEKTFDFEAQ